MEENKKNKKTEKEADVKETKKPASENAAEIEKLTAKAEEATKLADEYKDRWMRSVAEFDNYKKRNAKLWQDAYDDGMTDAILKLLPIGDNLDWALNMGLDEKSAEGIKNLKKKFNDVLGSLGVTEIDPTGQPFDPNIAEAVMQVEKTEGEESDYVKAVFEKGYKLKEKIIRYAKVSVTK